MLLTIGMIVKNEEDKLERCLNSLEPIRKAIDCELIIVDTGSTDNTVSIAQKYTENVRFFEWCNDFSAARNKSLENAKGEWFMFLDADEWFEDCSDIISFFKSGEYKKYNSAYYTVRSFVSNNIKGRYIDSAAHRLSKILKNTAFVNIIHEYINTLGEPLKRLYTVALHDGYVELNQKADCNKRNRNIELINKKISDSDGSDIMMYVELADMYLGFDSEMVISICNKAIGIMNSSDNVDLYMFFIVYKYIVYAYNDMKKYDEAFKSCKYYFEKRKDTKKLPAVITTDIEIYALMCSISCNIKDFDEALSAYKLYKKYLFEFFDGKHHTNDFLRSIFRYTKESEFVNINSIIAESSYKNKLFSQAFDIINDISYKTVIEYYDNSYLENRLMLDMNIMSSLSKFSRLNSLFGFFAGGKNSRENVKDLFEKCLLDCLFNFGDAQRLLLAELIKLSKKYKMSYNFSNALNLREAYDKNNADEIRNISAAVMDSYKVFPFFLADTIYYALKYGFFDKLVLNLDAQNIDKYYKRMNFKNEMYSLADAYYNKNMENISPAVLRIFYCILLEVLKDRSVCFDKAYGLAAFKLYADISLLYNSKIFKADILCDENIDFFPVENKIGYYSCMAMNSQDIDKHSEYIEKLIKLLPSVDLRSWF